MGPRFGPSDGEYGNKLQETDSTRRSAEKEKREVWVRSSPAKRIRKECRAVVVDRLWT
jgi:hypothetical protein